MKSHRLSPDPTPASAHDVAAYGVDNRDFPTGVNHQQVQPVVHQHPLPEMKVGPFIKDVGDGPGVWHGVAPSVSRETVEDEWARRQKEATMTAGVTTAPADNPDPVPVFIVNPNTGSEGISTWSGGSHAVSSSTEIAPRDYKRTRLFIKNEDTVNGIRITRMTGGSPGGFGFLIAAGEKQEIVTQDRVYAMPAVAGTTVNVSVLVEYGIDGGN